MKALTEEQLAAAVIAYRDWLAAQGVRVEAKEALEKRVTALSKLERIALLSDLREQLKTHAISTMRDEPVKVRPLTPEPDK